MNNFRAALLVSLALLLTPVAARAAADKPLVQEAGQTRTLPAATTLQLQAPTTANASINLPPGTAPGSPLDGDSWITSAGLYYRVGGVTFGPLTLTSVTCGTPLTGGTITTTGTCGIATNGLALSYLAQIGGSSYLGNQSTSTGNVTAYAWPTCANDGAHALVSLPSASPPIQCIAIGGTSSGSNPFYIGVPYVGSGAGAPSSTTAPVGSLHMRTDTADLYQQIVSGAAVPALVQDASSGGNSVTMSATPATGDFMVGFCSAYAGTPSLGSGWTLVSVASPAVFDPSRLVAYKLAAAGESTTQTPCSGSSGTIVFEVSGISSWVASYEGQTTNSNNFGGSSLSVSFTTDAANTLVLGAYSNRSGSGGSVSGLSGGATAATGGSVAVAGAAQAFATNGSSVSTSASFSSGGGIYGTLIRIIPGSPSWSRLSRLATIKNGGSALSSEPISLNCSTGTTCTASTTATGDDITITAAPAANSLALSTLAQQTANTVVGNFTGSTANLTANAMPSCSDTSGNHLNYVSGTGVTCGTSLPASPTFTTTTTTNLTVSAVSGSTQCLHANTSGVVSGTGSDCGAGGGGTTNNYYAGALTLIGSCIPVSTGTCTFSSIPASYTELVLSGVARSTTAGTGTDVIKVQLNGDTGSNYANQIQYTNGGTTPGAAQGTAIAFMQIGEAARAGTAANYPAAFEAVFPGYANATLAKSSISHYLTLSGGATTSALFDITSSNLWSSTSAVSSMTVFLASGNYASGSAIYLYGRGGSNVTVNPQPGLPVISETVTSGSQASVTVSAIPSTYRDLKIVASARGTNASIDTQIYVQLNGDTGSNYDTIGGLLATSGWAYNYSGLATTQMQFGYMPAASAPANWVGLAEITIGNYAGTNFYKSLQGTAKDYWGAATADLINWHASGQWRSTAAVTSLKIYPGSGNFADGTVITVYGIGGSPTATLPVIPPQGRLSLTSGVAVMTADATAQGTIYWVPLPGAMMPVGNIMYRVSSQLSYVLNTTAHTSTNLYDIGAYNSSGTITLCTAPAWTNSTTRSNAISQDATNGVWVNTASLTCNLSGGTTTTTIAAGQWTYLGTFYATANGQTGMAFKPSAASGGTNNILGLWNAYNRATLTAVSRDSASSWSYASTTWRATDNSNSNRISYVDGLAASSVRATAQALGLNGSGWDIGVNQDSSSASPAVTSGAAATVSLSASGLFAPSLGFHYLQAMEASESGSTQWFGANASAPVRQSQSLNAALEMHFLIMPLAVFRRRRRKPANDNAETAARAA